MLTSAADLRGVYRQPGQVALDKEVGHLDGHCRDFIAHAHFCVLATSDGAGRVDVSPKGGPPGFVSVLDDHHVAVEVTTAYLRCAKALRRSGLWEPDRWPEIADMASPAQMLRDHAQSPRTAEEVQRSLDEGYPATTWSMGGIDSG